MKELKQPYVGTHHLFLAYLKENKCDLIDYDTFKKKVKDIIGSCKKENEVILFTPLLRSFIDNEEKIEIVVDKILKDSNSIVYNILLSDNLVLV